MTTFQKRFRSTPLLESYKFILQSHPSKQYSLRNQSCIYLYHHSRSLTYGQQLKIPRQEPYTPHALWEMERHSGSERGREQGNVFCIAELLASKSSTNRREAKGMMHSISAGRSVRSSAWLQIALVSHITLRIK